MFKVIFHNVFMVLFLIMGMALMGCGARKEQQKKILVIHLYDYHPDAYGETAETVYEHELSSKKMDVEVRHIYLDWPHETLGGITAGEFIPQLRKLYDAAWRPDVIITHQDWSAHITVNLLNDSSNWKSFIYTHPSQRKAIMHSASLLREWLQGVPIVAASITHDDSIFSHWRNHNLLTGFRDSIDYDRNFDFFYALSGLHDNTIELGHEEFLDDKVRSDLLAGISNSQLYIDNSDFHLRRGYKTDGSNDNRHVVHIISLCRPELNCPPSADGSAPSDSVVQSNKWRISHALRKARFSNQVQARYSLSSNAFINKARLPQFSLINAQFGNRQNLILGGYFPTLQTEVSDALRYAQRILNGEQPDSLPVLCHRNTYNLDYEAMQLRGLDYGQWKGRADTIIHVPFRIRQPGEYWLLIIGGALLVMSAITWAAWGINRYIFHNEEVKLLMQHKENSEWLFSGHNSTLFSLSGSVITYASPLQHGYSSLQATTNELLSHTHTDDLQMVRDMLSFNQEEGKHTIRLRCADPKTGEYHWWAYEYHLTAENLSRHTIEGIVSNIDEQKAEEQQIINDLQAAEETTIKEAFLANMTHDIRTPLNCVLSFTSLLTSGEDLNDEERTMCAENIRSNSKLLLSLLSDAADMSSIRMGEYRFQKAHEPVLNLVSQAFQSNNVLIPDAIDFRLEVGEDVTIMVDHDRTMQVLNNFLSNAVKHTFTGTITLGWRVEVDEQVSGMTSEVVAATDETWAGITAPSRYVVIYVTDTGEGIAAENLPHLFDRYYKTDEANLGTGLGLSICQNIVEGQNGQIGVESKLGEGSTFWCRFKVCDEEGIPDDSSAL